LFGPREQAHGGEHQVMEAEDMGDGTVDLGELAHDGQGFAPVGAEAAEPGGNAQRQQAAVAQRVALGLGVPPRSSRSTAVRANSAAN
jgi:hypothetical protein